jgi:hypothetical protein
MTVIWELDFYSRPLLDDNQKKLWEVLICESPLTIDTVPEDLFRYSQFLPNTEVNSITLRQAIEAAIAQAPQRPDKIRFFRRQMTNMITKACEEAGIPAYASRRTLAMHYWLQQRMIDLYPTYPNYQAAGNPSVMLPPSAPQALPDALVGQKWALVSLPARDFTDLPEWDISFGEVFPLGMVGVEPDSQIPGLVIFSQRALPLAAWMSGLEVAFLKFEDASPARLVLETGAGEAWTMATLAKPQLRQEGERFEAAKQKANSVHFLAVQADPQAEAFAGFWLMQELNLA